MPDLGSSLVLGCLVWVPVAIWTLQVVNWTVSGDIDAGIGIIALILGLGLGLVTVTGQAEGTAPFLYVTLIAMMVAFPILRHVAGKRTLAELEVSEIERAYEALRYRPDNVAAGMKLAERLWERGLVGHAIAIAEHALQNAPKRLFTSEFAVVDSWKAGANDPRYFAPIQCSRCGHRNGPGSAFCSKCGDAYLARHARAKWLPTDVSRQILGSWSAVALSAVGIPLVSRFVQDRSLTIGLITSIVLGSMLLLGWSLWPRRALA